MPVIPAPDLAILQTYPHRSKLYLAVQQPERYAAGVFTPADFVWYGVVRVAPAVDPIISIEVTADAASPAPTVFDGMSVFIDSAAYGGWDRGIVRAHGDQTLLGAGANDTIYIAVSSDLSDVQVGDHIVILDEFKFWLRYPKLTETAGALTWYKDYGTFQDSIGEGAGNLALIWAQLGANDAARRQASMPAVPIMGPNVVRFIDPAVGSVNVDFDWSDSYISGPAGAIQWGPGNSQAEGETDHAGATWTDTAQNPAAKNYANISGLRGFRVWLELVTNVQDPIVEFRRGVRFVFTLRRPDELQAGDPSDAVPITDFVVDSMTGSFHTGYWQAGVRILASQAHEYYILPGALVIIFADDMYDTTVDSIGPDSITLAGNENIVMVGYVADGSVTEDSETGDMTFDIISVGQQMSNRENYSIPIDNRDNADEWWKTPDLTIDRAVHHYLTWHTTLKLIADLYQTGDTREIEAQDFLAENTYSAIDSFLQDRIFGRLLCDRFGRFACVIDQQLEAAAGAATLFTLTDADWHGEIDARDIQESPTSLVDLGGIFYNAGLITALLSHAPGEVSAYEGTPEQSTSLALSGQPQLNTLSGRLFAYRNNQWPELSIQMGNWRVFDIWPQEYIINNLALERHAFTADKFIPREITFEYDASAGALLTLVNTEMETDGPDGITIDIPEELPDLPYSPPFYPPVFPPSPEWGGEDLGRRIITTDIGVFVTDNIGATNPVWYAANTGLVAADDLNVYSISRDPWHWWTGTERILWAGTASGIWKHENFPYGTWTQVVTIAAINAITGMAYPNIYYTRMDFSIETEGRFAFAFYYPGGIGAHRYHFQVVQGGVIQNTHCPWPCGGNNLTTWPDIKFAQHSGGMTVYACRPAYDATATSRLYRTQDGGTNWTWVDTTPLINSDLPTISVPYVDADNPDSYVLWGDRRGHRISTTGGNSFVNLDLLVGYSKLGTGAHPDRIWLLNLTPAVGSCLWSNDRAVSWNDLPFVGNGWVGGSTTIASYAIWQGDTLQSVLVGLYNGGTPALMVLWQQGLAAWQNKEGNLRDFGIPLVYDIDRDSTGSA